jgi:histidine phosphotransferase ChpT
MGDSSATLDLQIMELACSRLCHDLISPVGAVGNGLELMEEEGDEELIADARRLVEGSCQRAAALLQLYRCAYGNAGNQAAFGPQEAVKLARTVLDAGRMKLDAEGISGGDWPAGFGKMTVNGILVAQEWLPRGGTLALTVNGSQTGGKGSVGFELVAEGSQTIVNDECARLLQCDRQGLELTAHNIQPYLLGLIARNHGFRLEMAQPAAGKVVLRASRAA